MKLTTVMAELVRESIEHAENLLKETGALTPFVLVTELNGDVRPLPLPAENLTADDLYGFVADVNTTIHAAAVVLDLSEPRTSIAILLEQAGRDAVAVVVDYRVREAEEPSALLTFGREGGRIRSFGYDVELDEPAATTQPRRIWLEPPWQAGLADDVAADFGSMIALTRRVLTSAMHGKSGFRPFMVALVGREQKVFGEPPGNPPYEMDSNNDVAVQEFRAAAAARADEYRAVLFGYDGYLDDGRDVACLRCEHPDGSVRELGYEYRLLGDGTAEFGRLHTATPRDDSTIFGA